MPALTRLKKSKFGTLIMVLMLGMILVGFAVADLQNIGSGTIGFGGTSSGTMVEIGDEKITEQDLSEAMQRRLAEVRQQRPDASYATILPDYRAILDALIDQRTLIAFANKFGFHLSKRLIDAEIAQIPGTRGLDGKFSAAAYEAFLNQRRLTDGEVREIIAGSLLQRYLLTPVAGNTQIPVGLATPYASMLLEAREGEAGVVPAEAFARGLTPTDAQVQQYYSANRARYTVPEQRTLRIAVIGPASVAGVTASEAEIAAYYKANAATYGGSATRNLTQVVVPDQNAANGIAARARGGASLAAAAGSNAAISSLTDQSRSAYASAAGERAAAAVFAAPSGSIVGPVQSDFGWIVARVDAVREQRGKTLDQARAEIAAKLNADKRKGAIEDLVAKVETVISEGGNFAEAAAAAKLPVTVTPLVMANGASRTNASVRVPQNMAPALKAGFEMAADDEPEVITLEGDLGYAMVAPASIVPAAPAPLSQIRAQVARDWVAGQSLALAKRAADAIAARVAKGLSLAEAMRAAGVALPPARPIAARRMQLAESGQAPPPPLQMLFSLAEGKSRVVADGQGRGFYVVKAIKITPGNALLQPALINRMQGDLRESVANEYAEQFVRAMQAELGLSRNDKAIAALRSRLQNSANQ